MAESSKSLTLALSGGLGAVAAFIPGELVQAIGPEATSVGTFS